LTGVQTPPYQRLARDILNAPTYLIDAPCYFNRGRIYVMQMILEVRFFHHCASSGDRRDG